MNERSRRHERNKRVSRRPGPEVSSRLYRVMYQNIDGYDTLKEMELEDITGRWGSRIIVFEKLQFKYTGDSNFKLQDRAVN